MRSLPSGPDAPARAFAPSRQRERFPRNGRVARHGGLGGCREPSSRRLGPDASTFVPFPFGLPPPVGSLHPTPRRMRARPMSGGGRKADLGRLSDHRRSAMHPRRLSHARRPDVESRCLWNKRSSDGFVGRLAGAQGAKQPAGRPSRHRARMLSMSWRHSSASLQGTRGRTVSGVVIRYLRSRWRGSAREHGLHRDMGCPPKGAWPLAPVLGR